MSRNATSALVLEIMQDYARLTGLAPANAHPRRYLWTDAFAVCNYFELFGRTDDETYRDLGLSLVDQVHHTLGRHRDDDSRRGWISGLDSLEGERHPTAGGLRIGKQLRERRPHELPNERLEWEQDGQYYHYLTKWMHALSCIGQVTADPTYIFWAIELAQAAHARFIYSPQTGGQMDAGLLETVLESDLLGLGPLPRARRWSILQNIVWPSASWDDQLGSLLLRTC